MFYPTFMIMTENEDFIILKTFERVLKVNHADAPDNIHPTALLTSNHLQSARQHLMVPTNFRISTVNQHFELCPTLPKLLMVPNTVSDTVLMHAARFRAHGRLPTISHINRNGAVLMRSAQPLCGLGGLRRSSQDEFLIRQYISCARCVGSGDRSVESADQDNISNMSDNSIDGNINSIHNHNVPNLVIVDCRSQASAVGNALKNNGGTDSKGNY